MGKELISGLAERNFMDIGNLVIYKELVNFIGQMELFIEANIRKI